MGWKCPKSEYLVAIADGRNPLSLDMGWKTSIMEYQIPASWTSQSAFAGYGLEEAQRTRS